MERTGCTEMKATFKRTFLVASLLCATPAFADGTANQVIPGYMTTAPQTNCPVGPCFVAGPYGYTPLSPGQHNFTITSSTALTIPAGATYATLCASTATIKYTTDGTTTPTSSVGQPLAAGSCVGLQGATVLSNLRLISATGTPDVEYFK